MDEDLVACYPELEARHFWWRVRRELILALVSDAKGDVGRIRILDLGCGSGGTLAFLRGRIDCEVLGVEMEESLAAVARGRELPVVVGDLFRLELGREFDVALMLDVLEHIEDDKGALIKGASFVRPGGTMLVTVPAYRWLWSGHDERNRHFRRYTRRELVRLAKEAGLSVERIGYVFGGLVLAKLASKWWQVTLRPSKALEIREGPLERLAQVLAYRWFKREVNFALLRRRLLPFGSSLVAVLSVPERRACAVSKEEPSEG
jgi:SAM-dependent methyltransferase